MALPPTIFKAAGNDRLPEMSSGKLAIPATRRELEDAEETFKGII